MRKKIYDIDVRNPIACMQVVIPKTKSDHYILPFFVKDDHDVTVHADLSFVGL
jgi:hypothetical protein